jgi:predicted branched-subunit amino acid permease
MNSSTGLAASPFQQLRQAVSTQMRHPAFRDGMREMFATALGVGAWGLVTGVAMVKSGMGVGMALFMSLLVYAGSAQLATLPLIMAGAPLWVVWLTAACVNLRFVIFSSLWRAYFAWLPRRQRLWLAYFSGDVIFAAFMKRYPDQRPAPDQLPFFCGAASTNWLAWQGFSIAGILLANQVPLSWGLGFAGTLALLGVLLSMLFDRASWLSAGVAATAAIAAFALPLKLNILVAIAAAVAVGLMIEALEKRRQMSEVVPEVVLVPADSRLPPEEHERVKSGAEVPLREERHP